MNIRIGITGAGGFLGGHILRAIADCGGVSISKCDVSKGCNLLNSRAAARFVRGKDVIIHAAAINRGSDFEVIAGSVVVTHNLINAIKENKSRAKLIFLSSIQAETETIYGISKKLTEIMLKDFSDRTRAPVGIFRLTNVFGEGCRPFYNSVVATFCRQVADGKKLTVHPDSRDKKMNLIYAKDAAKMIVGEVFMKRKNPFYFKRVSSRNEIKVGELAKLIESFKFSKQKSISKFHQDLYKTYLSYVS